MWYKTELPRFVVRGPRALHCLTLLPRFVVRGPRALHADFIRKR